MRTNVRPQAVILAEAPGALTMLCGVSLLERLLRILRRFDFTETIVVSSTPEAIYSAIEPPTWARRGLQVRMVLPNEINFREMTRLLVLPGNLYCDPRLIEALLQAPRSAQLVDSDPPESVRPLLADCRRDGSDCVSGAKIVAPNELESLAKVDLVAIDAAVVPSYVVGMRRDIRPVFFPAPAAAHQALARRIIFDTAQKGTLDIPAILQSPVEDWVLQGLCRTLITPNQITLFGFIVALLATVLFASGYLAWGMIPALAIGVIDGLDGKQARVKIETTAGGKWEHPLDFVFETSWWAALAYWFQRSGQLSGAWWFFGLILGSHIVDLLGKLVARIRIGRELDDYTPFDRAFRLIGARRDIYIWSLAVGLLFGAAASTYVLCAWWGVITASVYMIRALMILARGKTSTR
jgi:1L-myo-inositol 1-phosphate cytidylyltransferase / CDP-L-myo-inositol myo-inositolphosphotransferase